MRIPTLLLLSSLSLSISAQSAEEAQRLHNLGRESFNAGNVTLARQYTKQALDMRLKLFGEHNPDYITSLNNYALSFFQEKKYDEAIRLQERVMQLCDSLPMPHPNWGIYTVNMGRFYYLANRTDEAAAVWEKALTRVEKFSEPYEFLINSLSLIYTEKKDMGKLQHIMALAEEHNTHELSKPCEDATCMLERAQYYAAQGNTAEAREWYHKALALPLTGEEKVKALHQYALFFFQTHDYVQGAEQLLLAADAAKKIGTGNEERAADLLHKAGVFYFLGKDYSHALATYEQAQNAYAALSSQTAQKSAADCHYDQGNSYSALRQYTEATANYTLAANYYAQHDDGGKDYPKALLRQAIAEKFGKDYDRSIGHHRQAMELFKQRGLATEYAEACRSLTTCYAYAHRRIPTDLAEQAIMQQATRENTALLDRIIQDESSTLETTRQYLGQMAYAKSLGVIGGCHSAKKEYAQAVEAFTAFMPQLRDALRSSFRLESAAQRMRIWNDLAMPMQDIKDLLIQLPESLTEERQAMANVAYDAALLSKGILLNSSIEFSKVLKEKGDSRLTAAYAEAQQNEEKIEKLRQKASSPSDLQQIQSLTQANEALLLSLYKGCSELADFTDYLSYDWREVQQQLTSTDVAIEFVAETKSALDQGKQMLALVLTSDMDHPAVRLVGNLADLKAMGTDSLLFTHKDHPFWTSLSPWLKGRKRLFFSADDVLSCIGIEYLPYEGKPLSEQMEVYRLSSTKVLCQKHQEQRPTRAALFGDIDYNLNGTFSESSRPSLLAMRGTGNDEDTNVPLQFGNLAYTRQEVDDVCHILGKAKVRQVTPFKATEASKEAFEKLSGSKVDILHIATHGIYLSARNQTDRQSMDGSRLAFAGANVDTTALLTATEVASMDLRHCSLAVLSACESGLGKLGSDGVIGLQRGFKNAGVRTLLMSLRKVYDASTARLMTLFYSNLMNGHNKRESLILAQQQLRKEGYADAAHWASFILLDAW